MLDRFRSDYPNGGLISELVKIDCGKYIVKAIVVVDDITLATGLAAAETIELAEDRARVRALALLNLETTTKPIAPAPTQQSSQIQNPPITAAPTQQNLPTPKTTANSNGTEPDRINSPESISDVAKDKKPAAKQKRKKSQISPLTDLPEIPAVDNKSTSSAKDTKETPAQGSLFETNVSSSPFGAEEELLPLSPPPEPEEDEVEPGYVPDIEAEEAKIAASEPSSSNLNPTKSSESSTPEMAKANGQNEQHTLLYDDVINETNFHLRRIGWTNERGREYLIETYGKRSRHSLEDHELLQFLEYLKNQPDP